MCNLPAQTTQDREPAERCPVRGGTQEPDAPSPGPAAGPHRPTWRSFEATSHTGPGAHRAGPPGNAGFCYWGGWGAIRSRNRGDLWLCTTASRPWGWEMKPQQHRSPRAHGTESRGPSGGSSASLPAITRRPTEAGPARLAGRQGSRRRYVQTQGRCQQQSAHTVRGHLGVSTSPHRGRELHACTWRGRTPGHTVGQPPLPPPAARGPRPPRGSRSGQAGSTSAGDSAQGKDSGRTVSALTQAGGHPGPRGPARD